MKCFTKLDFVQQCETQIKGIKFTRNNFNNTIAIINVDQVSFNDFDPTC